MRIMMLFLLIPAFGLWAQNDAGNQPQINQKQRAERLIFDRWAANYLSEEEMQEPIPIRTGRAMKRMYRVAHQQEKDVGPAFELHKRILENPDMPLWALCGASCRLYRAVLEAYGYTAEMVSVWHSSAPRPHNGHEIIRFAGPGETEFRFYDPLYGVALVNEHGEWAGIKEIMTDLASGDPKLEPLYIEPYANALSPDYQKINEIDYAKLLYPKFFNAIVFRARNDSKWVVNIFDTKMVAPQEVKKTFESNSRAITVMVNY